MFTWCKESSEISTNFDKALRYPSSLCHTVPMWNPSQREKHISVNSLTLRSNGWQFADIFMCNFLEDFWCFGLFSFEEGCQVSNWQHVCIGVKVVISHYLDNITDTFMQQQPWMNLISLKLNSLLHVNSIIITEIHIKYGDSIQRKAINSNKNIANIMKSYTDNQYKIKALNKGFLTHWI